LCAVWFTVLLVKVAMTSSSSGQFIEFSDVTFSYAGAPSDRAILNGLSFAIPKGKVTALMGASGGGKTTVLRLIGGQHLATKGQVMVAGQDVAMLSRQKMQVLRRRMGMLFQFGALFTDLTVLHCASTRV
jgi:phospholipid/cholesterol/gamma-HCH transport system ATP-binding protein